MNASRDRSVTRERGRPRDSDVDRRILDATFEALAEVGFQDLTIDEIATAAGVAKSTLYRRWPSKEALIMRCIQVRAIQEAPPPSGHWRRDIDRAVTAVIEHTNTDYGRAFLSVLTAAYNNDDLDLPFSRDYEGAPALLFHAFEEGIAAGELRPDLDVDLLMDLVVAVIHFRVTALREDVDSSLAASLVDIILDGARLDPSTGLGNAQLHSPAV